MLNIRDHERDDVIGREAPRYIIATIRDKLNRWGPRLTNVRAPRADNVVDSERESLILHFAHRVSASSAVCAGSGEGARICFRGDGSRAAWWLAR